MQEFDKQEERAVLSSDRGLIIVWLVLISCTLVAVFFAEGETLTRISALFVCSITVLKAQLVIDYLIGLKQADSRIRKVMLGYVYVIIMAVALGIVCPDVLISLTSL